METLNPTQTQTNISQAPVQVKQLLNIEDVKAITGFSTTTIYKHIQKGAFPTPKKCGGRSVRWRLADVMEYVNS